MLAACAHAPPALHSTRLLVVERDGAVTPLVHATVAGKEIYLLLDTGATQSVLPGGFVQTTGLKTHKYSGLYMDANGAGTFMMDVPGVAVRFDGEELSGKVDFVMGGILPDGIGILSPQSLVASGWALTIDLQREELRADPEAIAVRQLPAPVQELPFHRCKGESAFDNAHRVVEVTVNGVAAQMLVDTGASRTAIYDDNPARSSVVGMKSKLVDVLGVGSAGGKRQTIEDLPVTFAGTTQRLRTVLLPGAQSCGQGVIGADLLRHCQLVWGKSSLWASCR